MIGVCLKQSLDDLMISSEQISLPVPALDVVQAECILSSLSKAMFETQLGNLEETIHAYFDGIADHYNRVGQNWRILGRNGCLLRQSRTSGPVQSISPKTQLLIRGDAGS